MHYEVGKGLVGPRSPTHFTQDEQQTVMSLWCATGAPLMFGGALPLDASDTWTLSLLTNDAVLAVHGEGTGRSPVATVNSSANTYAWIATTPAGQVLTLLNGDEAAQEVFVPLAATGVPLPPPNGGSYCAFDLWGGAFTPWSAVSGAYHTWLRPHASQMVRLVPCPSSLQ